MKQPISRWLGAVLIFFLSAGLTACSAGNASDTSEELIVSGFIEAETVSVVAETGGRVTQVLADEADEVSAGQVLVTLDDTLLQAERAQAVAAVAAAEANLAQLQAGARPEELAAAEAALRQAQAQLEGARRTAAQAWAAAANPQDIDVQIASAEAQVELAAQQVQLVQTQLDEARLMLDWMQAVPEERQDHNGIELQQYTIAALEAQLRAAEANHEGAQRKLELLQSQREWPVQAVAQARQSQSQIAVAQAQVDLAQAQLDLLRNGPLPQEIAAAQAQVDLAQVGVDLIDARIAQLTLVSPIDGVVTTRAIEVGETASPGVPLLTIANLETLKLVVYIPETQLGRIQLNAPVRIRVDAYPGETFEGRVYFISREAEFTPRNVQTEEERVSLVFAVEIRIPNPDGRLKPGMPADAIFSQ
jgi:HlyD family secretion protein